MIVGIGIDIIDIRRIEKTINKYGDIFIKKCFLQIKSFGPFQLFDFLYLIFQKKTNFMIFHDF